MKVEDQIAILENALSGALMVPSECAFVSTEVIQAALDAIKHNEPDTGLYVDGFNDGYKACLDRVKEHLYYLDISNIPNDLWNIGVDNMCEHIGKEMQKGNEK